MSTRAVYQPGELFYQPQSKLKRKHFCTKQPCRPGRCVNRDEQSQNISGSAVYHQRCVAVYQLPSKSEAKALLDDTPMSNRAASTAISKAKAYLPQVYMTKVVYQTRLAKNKHIWRRCMSPAWCSCIPAAIET